MTPAGEFTVTPKDNLRAMRILSAALIIGVVVFVTILVVINQVSGGIMDKEGLAYKNIFLYVSVGLAILCFVMAMSLYNRKKTVIQNSSVALAEKLNQYRGIVILYMALCEGAALFSLIVFFLTGNFSVLFVTAAMLVAMAIKFPFTKKAISELNLDWKDQQELG